MKAQNLCLPLCVYPPLDVSDTGFIMGEVITLKHTTLHALHTALGACFVPFAGYALPVQYTKGILAEHAQAREKAALFDVSHMGQAFLRGEAIAALERISTIDAALPSGRQRYGLLLNARGGIFDDFMLSHPSGGAGDALFWVVNAARKGADFSYLRSLPGAAAGLTLAEDRVLLALQGPASEGVLARHIPAVAEWVFMQSGFLPLGDAQVLISRSGYTGEDGFEISVPVAQAEYVARLLLSAPEVAPAGLGARDMLRLEAGLCLYGQDIDEMVTPAEAGLMWAIGKRRRAACDFPAAGHILASVPLRRRIGLVLDGRTPARHNAPVCDASGRPVGVVTSGGFSPVLNRPVAMAYVPTELSTPGMSLFVSVRNRMLPAHVTAMPFLPQRYKKS